jgi:HAD superfamily phosphatase
MEAKIIIWDIDGVLVYVADSYRQAIVDTVQYYFSECIGLNLDRNLMKRQDTQRFKLAGGFNDDWELTYAAVLCYLSDLICKMDEKPVPCSRPEGIDDMLESLKRLGSPYRGDSLELNIEKITERIKERGGGLKAAEKTIWESLGKDFSIVKEFFFPELIKRIFEEIYLGKELFHRKYGEKPRFFKGKGLISLERTLVDLETLLELRKEYYFGIVTGRERFEAEITLKEHFDGIFDPDLMVTSEDTEEKKPSPEPLLECKRRVIDKYGLVEDTGAIYVGDSIDDLKAAMSAGFQFVAVLFGMERKEDRERLRNEFQKKGCDIILDDVGGLARI